MKTYKHYIIYKITNLINGKIYIGKHRCNKLDDDYFGSGDRLRLAIDKYGLENFIFHLEMDLHSEEEMDLLEEMVVNKDFLARDDVYNLSRGGKNPCLYGKNNGFYGKTHSEEVSKMMHDKLTGVPLSEEHRKNIGNGIRKMYKDHPEIKAKTASRTGKKKCVNIITSEIRFFKPDEIPENFIIYVRPVHR